MSTVGPKHLPSGLAILIVLAVAGATVLRKPLLREGLEWWLADRDIPLSALTVERLDYRTLVLRDVSLGPGNVLSAGTVEVAYALPDLFSGEVQAVRLDNLRIDVDLERDPTQLEAVVALYRRVGAQTATGAEAAGSPLPGLLVGNGRFSFASAHGSAEIAFAASVLPDETGRLSVAADLLTGKIGGAAAALDEIAGPVSVAFAENGHILLSSDLTLTAAGAENRGPFAVRAQVEADFDPGGDTLDLSLALDSPDAGADARAGVRLTNLLDRPDGSFELSGSIEAAGKAWKAADAPADTSGTISAGITGALSLNPQTLTAASPSELSPAVEVSGTGRLTADTLTIPGLGRAATETIEFDINATETSLDLQVLPGSVLLVVPAETVRAGLPTAAAHLLAGELSVDLSQTEVAAVLRMPNDGAGRWQAEMQPRLALRAQNGARLTLRSKTALEGIGGLQVSSAEGETELVPENLSVALPGLQASDVRADLALAFSVDRASQDARLLRPGALSVGSLSAGPLRTQAPVNLVLTAGTFESTGPDAPKQGFSASLDMQPDDSIRAVVGLDGATDQVLEAHLGQVRLTGTGAAGDCSPTVKVEAPKEPITINLNVTLDANIRVQLEEGAREDIAANPDIF